MFKTTLLIIGLAAGAFAQNELTAQEKKDGWVQLFDGKTMKHWVDPRQKTPPGDAWTIEDGCLKATRHPRITEDLFSDDVYRDFELVFEWRISKGGNSGVKYRIQDHFYVLPPEGPKEKFELQVQRSLEHPMEKRPDKGQDYVVGFEYQITDDSTNRDALSNPKHTAGALYDMVKPDPVKLKPIGEFNESKIIVRSNHVEHWLNGEKLLYSRLDQKEALDGINKRWSVAPKLQYMLTTQPKRDCPISLQNHGDEAWFRNIRIRRL